MDFIFLHPFVRSTAIDKCNGTIIGSALGDVVGLYTEFLPATECDRSYPDGRFSLHPPTPFREDSHRDKFELGSWTDDTDQALLILLAFLDCKGDPTFVPFEFAQRLKIWVRQGLRALDRLPLGIGQTVGRVALDPEFGSSDKLYAVALRQWKIAPKDRKPAANGSLMRTHPVGIMCVGKSEDEAFETATDIGRTTHVDPRCVVSCCVLVALVRGIVRGEVLVEQDIDAALHRAWRWVDERETLNDPRKDPTVQVEGEAKRHAEASSWWLREEFDRHTHADSFTALELDDSQKMGYVYKALGSAILSLRFAMRGELTTNSAPEDARSGGNGFEAIISSLVMHGGDADTNACIAGALLGAWFGYAALPENWRTGLVHGNWLLRKSMNLAGCVGIAPVTEGWVPNEADTARDGGRGQISQAEVDNLERALIERMLLKAQARREAERLREKGNKGEGAGKWFRGLNMR
ncbi:ADP-ribosylglycohydrolase [Eremomyces bilateralis CBS 781.70]|uniref:ADP-ribosylglycohydrolase n=1 Tax=Eremomyces bilateralis CBS 781.70 TaxID=1392243 RepID=A0A6G1FSH3_9PEZI|nr:ADP-ribosylglycohydrolase [Eremomyces bilateralis CBS 781.70]KAF1808686.1 ADP-ribosylglycohydrolase [Eremomyces bilateralis CBS 781.70]